jgi:putative flippase GtrA
MTDIQLPSRSNDEGPSQSDRAVLVAFRSPKARAMLVMALLLSLGLWAAIWLALSSLALALAASSFPWHKILSIIVITTSAIVIRFWQRQSS